ncbi:hypothetical protein [uncultured Secundilactobacillus sp.]|uniref:hypothetical protein n=1 Tax=uncultured Secundilactobacillus sp. TaxID=2813935 RepID=UPI002585A868|nr:hypothetical protein [uncultured Secundilactobacillus sp.]
MSEYLRLTDDNKEKMLAIMEYAMDNPALIQRVKNSNVRVNRNNVMNAIVAEFYYLFIGRDGDFETREKSLLTPGVESLDQQKLKRQLNTILHNQDRLLYLDLVINGAANVTKTPDEPLPTRLSVTNPFGQWLHAVDERIDADLQQRRKH